MSELAIFHDMDGKKKFDTVDFIEVEVGQNKSMEAYLINTSEKFTITNIKESISDKDTTVINVPHQLQPRESQPITVIFKPSLNREEGLHSDIFFTGKKIIP